MSTTSLVAGELDSTTTEDFQLVRRYLKQHIRNAVLDLDNPPKERYGLQMETGWQQTPAEKNVVILLAGYNSKPSNVATLVEPARLARLPVGTYTFRNDQAITFSAAQFSDDLKRFAARYPDRGVTLVAYSMGGLVARAAIENPRLDPGNVEKLIMIAPPNHGTCLARFAVGMDVCEHFLKDPVTAETLREMFFASVRDGLNEAAWDLHPESPFLRELNPRRRNAATKYTIFLGSGGPLSEEELAMFQRKARQLARDHKWLRDFAGTLAELVTELDEVVNGKGDGVVSIASGRLQGVNDTVVMDFNHWEVGRDGSDQQHRDLHDAIYKRLTSR